MSTDTKKTASRRKKAAVLGVAGVVGIGAALTMANWTDEESAGAELSAGEFELEISTDGENWQTGTTVSSYEVIDAIDSIDAWGPGDYAEGVIQVRLAEGTTHDATLTSVRAIDDTTGWDITGPDSVDQTLATGAEASFTVEVEATDALAQGASGEVVWTFTAEQQAENPAAED